MKTMFCFISISMLMSVFGQEIDKDNIYFKVYEAAQKAQADDANGLKALYKLSQQDHRDEKLSKMMIKSVTLAMLKSGSKNVNNYFSTIESKFTGKEAFLFLDKKPFQVDCSRCDGQGMNPCHTCDKGVCRNCKGKKSFEVQKAGNVTVIKECAACKKTGICQTCNGSGQSKKMCRSCSGKGTVFSRDPIPEEYDKSLKYMIDNIPEYAAWKGFFIIKGIDEIVKRKKMEIAEKKKIEEEFRKNMPTKTGGNLKHTLLEFNEYFKNRERISKQKIYKNAQAKLIGDKPTVIIEVEEAIAQSNASLKLQYLEAFYQFWKLRCMFNSLGEDVGFIATHQGKKIAEFKGEKIIIL